MKPCTRVGIDITKRCNWRCKTCFYRHKEDFNTPHDKPLEEAVKEAVYAKEHGCDHVVIVGWGEPMLYPHLESLLKEVLDLGMTMSIITNGSVSAGRYLRLYDQGLDHLHVSVHGFGAMLDEIAEVPKTHLKQAQLLEELKERNLPWRANTTIQKTNYKYLPAIVSWCVHRGCRHWIALGFLPHYEWVDRLQEVAVHPAEIRPYLEVAGDLCHEVGALFTIRYHPMCHLDPKYWPNVTNARYVVYDPWEWCYNDTWPDAAPERMWENAMNVGNAVAITEEPCKSCALYMHCGGWNKTYAAGFDGAGLQAVKTLPVGMNADLVDKRGALHDLNPANACRGYFGG